MRWISDVSPEPLEEFARAEVRVARDPRKLARGAEIIGVCVREDAQVEALLLARTAGLSFEVFEEVTRSNRKLTDQMRAFLGLSDALEERADAAGLRQLVEGFAALAEKDLSIALESAGELGLALLGTGQCRDNMARAYGAEGGLDSGSGARGG